MASEAPRERRANLLEEIRARTPEGWRHYAYQIAANQAWAAGHVELAERWYREVIALWTRVGNLRAAGANRRALGMLLAQRGKFHEAMDQCLRGALEARRYGDENGCVLGLLQRCMAAWLAEDPSAPALLREVLAEPFGLGYGRYGLVNALFLTRAAYALGERELGRRLEGEALVRGGADAAAGWPNYAWGPYGLGEARGWDAWLNGDYSTALQCCRAAVEAATPRWRDDRATALEHLGWALAASGETGEAARVLAEAQAERDAMGMVLYPVEVPHHERAVALVG
jgi:tetratricopeptide (TPR) repeat protein